MSRRLLLPAATISAMLLVAAPASAQSGSQADSATILREASDRAAIEKLMWDYVKAADSLNPDAYVAVFTPDGAFGQTKGSEALRGMIDGMRETIGARAEFMHHVMSNQNIEFVGPDAARVYYYWQTVFGGPAGAETPPRVAAVGRGVDDVVRVNGKWLIANRNVSLKF